MSRPVKKKKGGGALWTCGHCSLTELSVRRALFCSCPVQHGDHQLHVATENLKAGQWY